MAGIYIHIPFCKTRCTYCDFYSTTHSEWKSRYIQALCRELKERKEYLEGAIIETVYLGGGTPSQLSEEDFRMLFSTLEKAYDLSHLQEVTLEANPDDLTESYLSMLRSFPFNRISMGIQTFDDPMLKALNRRHTASQAIRAVEACRHIGFHNLSIDLIYGLPGETPERWQQDLQQAISLNVPHISAYHLIYEKGTPIYQQLQQRHITEVDEENSLLFFTTLIDTLTAAGYEHYEISNFCQPNMHSRHNTSYWKGISYLGCGPAAHSFNGTSREWNVASLETYMSSMEQGKRAFELEERDLTTRYNEYIITSLRTRWGLSMEEIEKEFGAQLQSYCLRLATPYLENGQLELHNNYLRLTRKGIFVSDSIMSDLLSID